MMIRALAVLLLAYGNAALSQVTLTASPTSGTGSVTPSLTWSAPAGSTCTASGGWTGTKAVAGTQAQAAITATTTYTLSCVPAAVTTAVLSWSAPTLNTDGSALTDLAGFKVYKGASAGSLTVLQTINSPTTLTYTITGLTPGTTYAAVSAFNTGGVESALSAVGNKVISAPVAVVASVTVTVSKVPMPPTNFTVAVVDQVAASPAYKILTDGTRSSVLAGFVEVGKPCIGNVIFRYRGVAFRKVAASDVRWWATTPTDSVAASCG